MASYNKFNQFPADLAQKVHNLSTSQDQLKAFLTNTAPNATDATLSQITEVSYANCSSRNITISASSQSSGTFKLVISDLVLTASGTVGPFRYVGVYNDTPTSPADPLICWFDYGSSITLNNTDTFTLDADGTNGLFQIA